MDKDIKLSQAKCQISDVRNYKLKVSPSYSVLCLLSSVFCLYFIAGCESASSQKAFLQARVDTLTLQNTQLENQLEQSQAEKEQLKN